MRVYLQSLSKLMRPKLTPGVRLDELAQYVQGQVHGEGKVLLTGVASLEQADPGDLVFVTDSTLSSLARQSHASAFVTSRPVQDDSRPQLITPNPLYAFACLTQRYFLSPVSRHGIADTVVKGSDVRIGPDTSIGAFVTLGDRVQLGARVTLYPGVVIGHDVVIGDDTILYPNVTVLDGCQIGARVIVQCGSVIGSDGFGYVVHQGRHQKVPQLGSVVIEDDVELGANVTVDRATFGCTTIKRGTKIDNQVQIAHNVQIGEDCILVAQVGIAGSTTVGHHVLIGGQAGLTDHLTIGDQAKIAAGSGVSRSVKAGKAVGGSMAFDYTSWLKVQALIQRLPEMRKEIQELKAKLADREARH
ncbi:MAG: UDP-3-O-acylglucosamine N-acyltransferase [Nitrospirales bacterium]|nr:MAG: UDP-3-O-acylglucosamine N-acyltransferase [Nitrospirales bacterium]